MLQKEEKYEENKTNFEGVYLRNGLVDSAQIRNWGAPPQRNLYRKICVFLLRECQATDVWKRHFLYSCKINTHTWLLATRLDKPYIFLREHAKQ